MKKITLAIVCVLLLVGCAQNEGSSMDDMPCHQMPDGSWMGNCDETPQHEQEFSVGEGAMDTSRALAQSSSIVDVADGDVFSIEASIVKKKIRGKEILMYAYNNMIPGPAIRVQQNSTIYVNVTNNIDLNTTVHWHGLRHNISDDGVPGVSQKPITPGKSHFYTLYFPDDGIFWYHPHIREDIQQESGLAGNILVVPNRAYNPVNREELLVLDDILVDDNGEIVPFGRDHANFALMGRFGNVMLTNGQEEYQLSAHKGEVVRFYVTNVANVRPFNISIPGAEMKLVGGDLGEFEHEEFVSSVTIAPAMRYIIDVHFPSAMEYALQHITPDKKYTLGKVSVTDEEVDISHYNNFANARTNDHVIKDIERFEPFFDKPADYNLTLTVDITSQDHEAEGSSMANLPCHVMGGKVMGDCTPEEVEALTPHNEGAAHQIEWEDDMQAKMSSSDVKWVILDEATQKENMEFSMQAKVGDVVKVSIFNDPESEHPMQHPIHLHGQRFILTSMDGVPIQNKVWTDTILIPVGSRAEIVVDVTNPGNWMMHCHIAEHLEAGMMTAFKVI